MKPVAQGRESMKKWIYILAIVTLCFTLPTAWLYAESWPQWRGPDGNGVSMEKGIPTSWDGEENVAWKQPLEGRGLSSPIVWGERVFLTSQRGRGIYRLENDPSPWPTRAFDDQLAERHKDDPEVVFLVQAFHRSDGRRLWKYELKAEGELPSVHVKHNLATPTCVTDGETVYALFGNGQLAALDAEKGHLRWKRHLGQEYSPFLARWGHSSSPVIYKDMLLLLCDHEPGSYLLSLDRFTGQEKWKVDRGKGPLSFSTPLLIKTPQGERLIINSSQRIDAYQPDSGELLWFVNQGVRYPIASPVYSQGIVYMSRGSRTGPYLAIQTGGKGDVSETHVLWKVETGAPYVSSLIYYQGMIYMATEMGIVSGIDASSGEIVWRKRLGGTFSASPVAADGKIYLLSETGETIVLKAGREGEVLARNSLGEPARGSPAISGGQIFIRTEGHFFCIENHTDY